MTRSAHTSPAPTSRPANTGPFLIILFLAVTVFIMLAAGLDPWDTLFINPLINALILLDRVVLGQLGLAIILFTLIMRLVTLPITIRQFKSVKAMQAIQPLQAEIQKKHKDPQRRNEEMMKLWREHGVNPLGCAMPMIIQMVVFMALYRALVRAVGSSPEALVGLSQRLYPWSFLHESVPLNQHFLWLNLGEPDRSLLLPILVAAATYVQQKITQVPNANPQQAQQQQMMTWMFPLMMLWISLSLPSGVGVYWVATNIFALFTSYYVYGRSFNWRNLLTPFPSPAPAPGASHQREKETERALPEPMQTNEPSEAPIGKERRRHGKRRGKRKNR